MEKEIFEKILNETASSLFSAYDKNCEECHKTFSSEKTRIVFPKKQKTVRRISEQELRFEFIHQLLLKTDNYWYSIETPTYKNYSGFSNNNPNPVCNTDENLRGGQSGAIDTVIYDQSGKRKALIEFKAESKGKLEYWKDFVKMNHEKVENKYFVQLFEAADDATFKNIENHRFKGDGSKDDRRLNSIKYYCIILNKKSDKHKSRGVYSFNGEHISALSEQG